MYQRTSDLVSKENELRNISIISQTLTRKSKAKDANYDKAIVKQTDFENMLQKEDKKVEMMANDGETEVLTKDGEKELPEKSEEKQVQKKIDSEMEEEKRYIEIATEPMEETSVLSSIARKKNVMKVIPQQKRMTTESAVSRDIKPGSVEVLRNALDKKLSNLHLQHMRKPPLSSKKERTTPVIKQSEPQTPKYHIPQSLLDQITNSSAYGLKSTLVKSSFTSSPVVHGPRYNDQEPSSDSEDDELEYASTSSTTESNDPEDEEKDQCFSAEIIGDLDEQWEKKSLSIPQTNIEDTVLGDNDEVVLTVKKPPRPQVSYKLL